MENLIDKYSIDLVDNVEQIVKRIANDSHRFYSNENLNFLFSIMDLTSLNTDDNVKFIEKLFKKVTNLKDHYADSPEVAAVCVYPPFVSLAGKYFEDTRIQVAAVGANFPSSQTYLNVKKAECKEIINHGANEVDIVIPVGEFMAGNYDEVYREIKEIKETIENNKLKVILETGLINSYENIQLASIIAMEAGADFIKTSTGKMKPAATYDAVYVMCKTIRSFYEKTGKPVGIKPAGGISTVEDAFGFYSIVREVLGDQWLNSSLFRIGASRLANDILRKLYENEEIAYF
jgi:deoxyribose-phosphate aldolase